MTERHPDDVEAIRRLEQENFDLTRANQTLLTELGDAKLRAIALEREIAALRGGDQTRIKEFDRLRQTALENGRKGVFQS